MLETSDQLNQVLVQLNEAPPHSRLKKTLQFFWRWTKHICFWGMVIGIPLLVCLIIWFNHQGQTAINQFKAELAKRGIKTIVTPDIPEEQNGTSILKAAIFSMHKLPDSYFDSTPIVGIAKWPQFGEGFTPEQATHVAQMTDRNATAYRLMDEVCAFEQFYFGFSETLALSDTMETLMQLGNLTKWLQLRSLQLQSEGAMNRAAIPLRQSIFLAKTLRNESSTNAQIRRISIIASNLEEIENLLSRGELTQEQLAQLHDDLLDFENEFSTSLILEQDILRAFELTENLIKNIIVLQAKAEEYQLLQVKTMLNFIKSMGSDVPDIDLTANPSALDWCSDTIARQWAYWCPGFTQKQVIDTLLPLVKTWDQLHSASQSSTPDRWSFMNEDSNEYGHPTIDRIVQQLLSRLRAMGALLKCEMYRQDKGHWPSALTDVYEHTPKDAWGHEIRMIRVEHGIRVYSVDMDGIDDQGSSRNETMTKHYHATYDWTWRLLDKEYRNAPPTITKMKHEQTFKGPLTDYFNRAIKAKIWDQDKSDSTEFTDVSPEPATRITEPGR